MNNLSEQHDVRGSAVEYSRRGYFVTPLAGKRPISEEWDKSRLTEPDINELFGRNHNVGVILGASGLVDFDFDDAKAVAVYRVLDPPELRGAAVFHHAGRPHVIVRATDVATRRYKRGDGSVLLELRGDGAQTVFPPSIHPDDGLQYEWVNDCEPPDIDGGRLQTLACMIATATYASEFWTEGSRHDLALAVAGYLLRRVDEADVLAVLAAAAHVAGDVESTDRSSCVATTMERLRAGRNTVGLPTVANIAPDLARMLDLWWRAVPASDGGGAAAAKRPSQADALVDIGRTAELFHDATGTGFARLDVDGHAEIWPLRATRFKSWLRRQHYFKYAKAPGNDAVNAACGVLEGIAVFDGSRHELDNRAARLDDAIYYDLADASWRSIRIGPDGWEGNDRTPILFRRFAHQQAQVMPARDGDIGQLLDFINVRDSDKLLLFVWLVAAFVPDIPHPIPDFHGEKGAAKSSGQRVLRRLIDPSAVELLAFPRDVTELVQQLSHHYAPVYDNIDSLPPWIADVLCRAVTGEGFTKRELYSDDDDVIYSYRRVIMLNGVNVVPQRSDLLDRSILLGLERISGDRRREEREFWAAFEAARPRILGGIFDVLSEAMRRYPEVHLDVLERMADFTHWGAAIADALGASADDFIRAYSSNRRDQTVEAVEGDLVAAVLALMEDRNEWHGTPSGLLHDLEVAGEAARLFRRNANGKVDAKGWPGAPHILTRRLKEIRSNLAELGIQQADGRSGARSVTLTHINLQPAQSSVSSVSSVGLNLVDAASNDGTDATDATFPALRQAHGGAEREQVEL